MFFVNEFRISNRAQKYKISAILTNQIIIFAFRILALSSRQQFARKLQKTKRPGITPTLWAEDKYLLCSECEKPAPRAENSAKRCSERRTTTDN